MRLFYYILVLALFNNFALSEDLSAEFYFNGSSSQKEFNPNSPISLEIIINDNELQETVKNYKEMHGKLMHLLLWKDDLSILRHVHPYFDPITGRFFIMLNLALNDPDNFDTKNALVEPGKYHVMADVEIKGIGMRMFMTDITVKGHSHHHHLMEDHKSGPMTYLKNYTFNEDEEINFQAEYKLSSIAGCNGSLLNLSVDLKVKLDGVYQYDPLNFSEWLKAGAHGVIISSHKHTMPHEHFVNNMQMPGFAHMHALLPPENAPTIFEFNFFDENILKKGLNKIWLQVKYKNNVYTLPLVFNYLGVLLPTDC